MFFFREPPNSTGSWVITAMDLRASWIEREVISTPSIKTCQKKKMCYYVTYTYRAFHVQVLVELVHELQGNQIEHKKVKNINYSTS